MVSFSFLYVSLSAVAALVLSTPLTSEPLSARQSLTTSSTGESNGFFYSFFTDGGSQVFTLEAGGGYSITWSGDEGNFVAGKGFMPGSAQDITYSASFDPTDDGNAYLSVYGWTTNPLVEYYINEAHGDFDPSTGGTFHGTVTSDGAVYNIYSFVRTDQPSIEGTSTFNQFWSIRQTERTSGTVTTANHFNAWAELGLEIGEFNYQIVATEGFDSSGSSSVTVN